MRRTFISLFSFFFAAFYAPHGSNRSDCNGDELRGMDPVSPGAGCLWFIDHTAAAFAPWRGPVEVIHPLEAVSPGLGRFSGGSGRDCIGALIRSQPEAGSGPASHRAEAVARIANICFGGSRHAQSGEDRLFFTTRIVYYLTLISAPALPNQDYPISHA